MQSSSYNNNNISEEERKSKYVCDLGNTRFEDEAGLNDHISKHD
jgi:hypothetical protein